MQRAPGGDPSDDAVARAWRAVDPPPDDLADAAKAAFTRPRTATAVLPVVLDVRAPTEGPTGEAESTTLLVFGTDEADQMGIEVELSDRSGNEVSLRCAVRGGAGDPVAVLIESGEGTGPLTRRSDRGYGDDAVPAGPARIVVVFDQPPGRSVMTTWFTV